MAARPSHACDSAGCAPYEGERRDARYQKYGIIPPRTRSYRQSDRHTDIIAGRSRASVKNLLDKKFSVIFRRCTNLFARWLVRTQFVRSPALLFYALVYMH